MLPALRQSTVLGLVVFGGFIPGFGIAYFPLQVFGVERGLIEFFAGGGRRPCFSIVHDKCERTTAPKAILDV